MLKEEKIILKKIADYYTTPLSEADLLNNVGRHNSNKIIHKLISEGYIEEVPTRGYTYYRLSKSGYSVFKPFFSRAWSSFKGDVRTIVVSLITTIVTTTAIYYIKKFF